MPTLLTFDRVQETSTTTGTSTYVLAGAVAGYRTFTSVLANSDTCFYCATDNVDFEIGIGTFTTSGTTLARTVILASSNAGSAVSWAAGTRNVFITNVANYVNPLVKVNTTHAIRVASETSLSSTLGNARGTGAVDLQTKRSSATQVASGTYSVLAGGKQGRSSGTTSAILGGYGNIAAATSTVCCGGTYNSTSGTLGFIGGGKYNQVNATYATISGGLSASADKYGQQAYASGRFSTTGDAQTSLFVLRNQTTNSTPTELYLNGSGASQRLTLSNDTSWAFEILVIARRTDADSTTGAWKIFGVIDRQTNAASTALVAEPSLMTLGADNTGWAVAVSADTTNGSLKITATGATSQTVNFVARVEVTETTG